MILVGKSVEANNCRTDRKKQNPQVPLVPILMVDILDLFIYIDPGIDLLRKVFALDLGNYCVSQYSMGHTLD